MLFVVCLCVFRFSFCTGDVDVDFSTACVQSLLMLIVSLGTWYMQEVCTTSYLVQMPIAEFYAK